MEGFFIRHPPRVPMCWPECLWQGTVLWSGCWSLAACHCGCCFSTQHCSSTHLAVLRDCLASSLMPFPLAALAQTHFMDGLFKPPSLLAHSPEAATQEPIKQQGQQPDLMAVLEKSGCVGQTYTTWIHLTPRGSLLAGCAAELSLCPAWAQPGGWCGWSYQQCPYSQILSVHHC